MAVTTVTTHTKVVSVTLSAREWRALYVILPALWETMELVATFVEDGMEVVRSQRRDWRDMRWCDVCGTEGEHSANSEHGATCTIITNNASAWLSDMIDEIRLGIDVMWHDDSQRKAYGNVIDILHKMLAQCLTECDARGILPPPPPVIWLPQD